MALSADPDADGLPDAITPSALFDPAPLTTSARGARTPEQALTPSTTSHASAARATILGLLAQLQAQVRAARTAAAAVAAVAGGKDGREGEDELAKARDAAAQATIRELEDELGPSSSPPKPGRVATYADPDFPPPCLRPPARLQAQLEERQDFMEDFMKKSSAMHSALDGVRAGVADDDGAESGDALARQRDALEDDRRRFTEAAVKLGKDRTELEVRPVSPFSDPRGTSSLTLPYPPPLRAHLAGRAPAVPRGEALAPNGGAHCRPASDARPPVVVLVRRLPLGRRTRGPELAKVGPPDAGPANLHAQGLAARTRRPRRQRQRRRRSRVWCRRPVGQAVSGRCAGRREVPRRSRRQGEHWHAAQGPTRRDGCAPEPAQRQRGGRRGRAPQEPARRRQPGQAEGREDVPLCAILIDPLPSSLSRSTPVMISYDSAFLVLRGGCARERQSIRVQIQGRERRPTQRLRSSGPPSTWPASCSRSGSRRPAQTRRRTCARGDQQRRHVSVSRRDVGAAGKNRRGRTGR